MKLAQQGRSDDIPLSRLDRVRLVWEKGVGYDHDHDDGGVVDEVWKVVGFRLLIKLMLLDLLWRNLNHSRRDRNMICKALGGIGSWRTFFL